MLIVQKFGGTSMGSVERIRNVAHKILAERALGNKVVVVVSAMSGITNSLISLFEEMCQNPISKTKLDVMAEYDSIISTGEQVSSGLLAAYLNEMGHRARSVLGWQIPFVTDANYSKARIEEVKPELIQNLLEDDIIPIITGFQGVTHEVVSGKKNQSNLNTTLRVTTIGRGGSDTSAIAIAASIKADRCDIYTDVDGIYTADPRIVKNAKKLDEVGYEETLEMASSGAKVLETTSVAIAAYTNTKVRVLSSFENELSRAKTNGTMLINDNEVMKQTPVTSVTSNSKEVQITVIDMPDDVYTSARLFKPLNEASLVVDMIAQTPSHNGKTVDITFTVALTDLIKTKNVLEEAKSEIKYNSFNVNESVAKISIIGVGMRTNCGVAYKMFDTLAANNIKILAISTSEIKTSVLIDAKYEELAVRCLHDNFSLDLN